MKVDEYTRKIWVREQKRVWGAEELENEGLLGQVRVS